MIDDDLNSPVDLRYPQKGDVLFESAEDWYHNACINLRFFNWDWYASGYKHAGDVLVQHVIDTRDHRDTLVFPIVFNYRQYLELRLKELIFVGRQLSNEAPEFPATHNLRDLWNICRPIIAEPDLGATETDFEAIDDAISEFCLVDPGSYSFRYPVDRDGSPSISDTLRVINLRQLRDRIDALANFLDGVSMAFSAWLDDMAGAYL
jgi:hypothetical protein